MDEFTINKLVMDEFTINKLVMDELVTDGTVDNLPDVIEHIVLSGGGVYGFSAYGALEHLHKSGYWNINNIKSIYGTSIGAIFGTIISLKYDWQITHDYLVKRPWNKVFNFDMYSIINSFQKRGIFDIHVISEIFKPLFGGLDISMNVTMSELYAFNHIDLHLFVTDFNEFETVDISHSTHPDWLVVDAVYASAALPILFSPLLKDSKYYIDGGILCNYPIKNCINLGASYDTTIGLHRASSVAISNLTDESTIFDYLFLILYKILHKMNKLLPESICPNIIHKHYIDIEAKNVSLYDIYLCTNFMDERVKLVNAGIDRAKEFLSGLGGSLGSSHVLVDSSSCIVSSRGLVDSSSCIVSSRGLGSSCIDKLN